MTTKSASEIFNELLACSEDGDEELLLQKFDELRADGVSFMVVTDSEDPDFNDGYTEVIQYCQIEINGEVVSEWVNTYHGYYGGGGTGWWIGLDDSSIEFEVEEMLELADLKPKRPDVPEPDDESTPDSENY